MEEELKFAPRKLSKVQAQKIAKMASSIYTQGQSWVLSHMDLTTGVTRLVRGLSHGAAKRKLAHWRKEKVEELLREDAEASAFLIRKGKNTMVGMEKRSGIGQSLSGLRLARMLIKPVLVLRMSRTMRFMR